MSAPPGQARTSANGITGTRTKAETKRHLAGRVVSAMKSAGLPAPGWQVRSLVATLIANREEPTDEDVYRALMAAPWFPKARRRHWRVGEGGGWAVTS